jgi:hypothetical protein
MVSGIKRRRQVVINQCCKALAIAQASGRNVGLREIVEEKRQDLRPFLEVIASTKHMPRMLAERILERFNHLDGLLKILAARSS